MELLVRGLVFLDRVREALVEAIDLNSLVEAVYQGTGTPTGALVPPALWGHNAWGSIGLCLMT